MCSWWVFQLIQEELFYPTLLNFRGSQIQLKIEFSGQALEPNCKLKFQCKTQQPQAFHALPCSQGVELLWKQKFPINAKRQEQEHSLLSSSLSRGR